MKSKLTLGLLVMGLLANGIFAQTKPDSTFKHTARGVLYHIFSSADTMKIKLTDVITFQVIEKTDKDSVLYSSFDKGVPIKIQVQPARNIDDLMDIFPLMKENDSALVKVPTDSIFKDITTPRPLFLPAGSYIDFFVKITKVQSLNDAIAERNAALAQMKAAEAPGIAKYIADHKLVVKTTLSGLKYVITKPSLKAKPLKGDTVFVNYTGRLVDGTVFDSSIQADALAGGLNQPGRVYEPLKFVLGHGEVIPGWDEGLLLINTGAKATFVIPSALAYGANGNQGIDPYSPLVFDIELVKIAPCKHPVVKHTIAKKPVKKVVKKTN